MKPGVKTEERNPGSGRNPPRAGAVSRRMAIGLGAAGVAGIAGGASLLDWLSQWREAEAPADIFKGDAPKGELWELWRRRGWVREAAHYLKLGRNVQCKVCPNNCLLSPGDRSHCRNRVNVEGTLYTLAYANPCTFHVDPVEKKPLFHFLPGTRTFSLATAGCVFRCLNCQNWEISQKKPEETKDPRGPELRFKPPLPERLSLDEVRRLSLFPEDLPAVAQALKCPSISYTYSEPTAYYEYAFDSCKAARERGVKNILVTCGSIEQRPLAELLKHVDAAHVDLKGFNDDVYHKLNSGKLQPILDTLKLFKSTGTWFEIINLIVPTYTDDLPTIRRMCDWIAKELGPDTPLHFSRFHPQYKLRELPVTPDQTLDRAEQIARDAGLHYVYIGNRPGELGETTTCPHDGETLIRRVGFQILENNLRDGACPKCRRPAPGVWK